MYKVLMYPTCEVALIYDSEPNLVWIVRASGAPLHPGGIHLGMLLQGVSDKRFAFELEGPDDVYPFEKVQKELNFEIRLRRAAILLDYMVDPESQPTHKERKYFRRAATRALREDAIFKRCVKGAQELRDSNAPRPENLPTRNQRCSHGRVRQCLEIWPGY